MRRRRHHRKLLRRLRSCAPGACLRRFGRSWLVWDVTGEVLGGGVRRSEALQNALRVVRGDHG